MKKGKLFISLSIVIVLIFSCSDGKENNIIKENFDFAARQLPYAFEEIKKAIEGESDNSIHARAERGWSELTNPRSLNPDGSVEVVPSKDWCSGFFPGILWFMYEYTRDEKWAKLAHRQTIILEREKYNDGTHDMGFKLYCSYGNGFRLTGNPSYRNVLLQAAKTLVTRYNPIVGCIRSWDFGKDKWEFPVIIDNMLNLELLFWASHETGDSIYYNIAVNHADATMENHFRPDYSTWHVVDYCPRTGMVRQKNTHQGYSDSSSWSRGQAWALYGYTMCYRETGRRQYLEQAKAIAEFIFTHPNLSEDLIPYWDYNAPGIPNESRDVSAATCMASALYELTIYDEENKRQHKARADKIIKNVSANNRATPGRDGGFFLLHSTGSKPGNMEVDIPIIYADYYFMEALLRKQNLEKIKE